MKSSIGFLLLSAQSISIVAFSSTFSSRGISNRVKNCWSSWPVKSENIRPIIARKNLSSSSEKYPSLSRIKSSLLVASLPGEEIIEIVEHDSIPSSSDEDSKDSKRSAFAKSLVTHLQIDVSKRPYYYCPVDTLPHFAQKTSTPSKRTSIFLLRSHNLILFFLSKNIASSSDMTPLQKHIPTIVGHRGSLYRSLENTRHSFRVAAEHCSEIECDVFLLKVCLLCCGVRVFKYCCLIHNCFNSLVRNTLCLSWRGE